MTSATLQHRLPAVTEDGMRYAGGSQLLLQGSARGVGCGLVGAACLLQYLTLYHGLPVSDFPELASETLEADCFRHLCRRLQRRYLPLIPHFGINGLGLAFGINLFFRHRKAPFRARWCCSRKHFEQRLWDMLSRDIPVILAVGPNFPLLLGKEKLPFYRMQEEGRTKEACRVNSHYVIATACDGDSITVSSWGRWYRISLEEYRRYMKETSLPLVTNLLEILPA